jgi:hypothetical protein
VDVHASDLVGINGITRDLIVHIHQQDVYSRGHILPLWPPLNETVCCWAYRPTITSRIRILKVNFLIAYRIH